MSVEAPITKVINIILAAQENQPSYIAQALDKVARQTSSQVIDYFSHFVIKTNSEEPILVELHWELIISKLFPTKLSDQKTL